MIGLLFLVVVVLVGLLLHSLLLGLLVGFVFLLALLAVHPRL